MPNQGRDVGVIVTDRLPMAATRVPIWLMMHVAVITQKGALNLSRVSLSMEDPAIRSRLQSKADLRPLQAVLQAEQTTSDDDTRRDPMSGLLLAGLPVARWTRGGR